MHLPIALGLSPAQDHTRAEDSTPMQISTRDLTKARPTLVRKSLLVTSNLLCDRGVQGRGQGRESRAEDLSPRERATNAIA